MIAAAFAVAALLLGALALRHGRWPHVASYLGSIACVATAVWFAFGTPRPVWFGHKRGITILAMAYQEGDFLAFWTRDGNGVPVAYILPWSEQKAAEAQHAMKKAKEAHTTVRWGSQRGGDAAGQRVHGQAGHSNGSGGASAGGGNPNSFSLAPHQALPPKEAAR